MTALGCELPAVEASVPAKYNHQRLASSRHQLAIEPAGMAERNAWAKQLRCF